MRKVVDASVLGAPVADEGHWASAGGGWAQQYQRGWALVADDGRGGMVAGSLLPYFTAHGYVNATGWPTGNAVTDAKGTYQRFGSKGGSVSGTLMSGPSGVYRLQGGMEQVYFAQGLRSTLGSLMGEESRWAAGGGGWAQHFTGGWLLYKSSTVKGYVPSSFPWPDLGKLGWPKSGPQAACGGQKITFEYGDVMQDGRWCPAPGLAQPTAGPYTPVAGYTLGKGMNGVKAYLVYKALYPSSTPSKTSSPLTASVMSVFTRRTGGAVVDAAHFSKLNTGWSFNVDAWKAPSTVATNASRSSRVAAMVAFAKLQADTSRSYVWGGTGGGSGSSAIGFDCSGLVLQAMRAGGLDPKNVGNITDVRNASDLSNAMLHDGEFQRLAPSLATADNGNRLMPGDLVFWGYQGSTDASDRSAHVALYAGSGVFYQAVTDGVKRSTGGFSGALHVNSWTKASTLAVLRPFAS